MKIWQIVILIMIILRIIAFTFCYFKILKKMNKTYSKYDIKHEWLLLIIMVVFFTEIILFLYFIVLIGEIAININQNIHDFSNNLAHKICKKILKEDKK